MKSPLNLFSKVFISVSLILVILKIEFFPFSNYQMYSKPVLPEKELIYYKIKALGPDNQEIPYINRKYGLFHAEQPLIESVMRKLSDPSTSPETLLSSLLVHTKNKGSRVQGLRLYKIHLDWDEYKKNRLSSINSKPNFTSEIISEVRL